MRTQSNVLDWLFSCIPFLLRPICGLGSRRSSSDLRPLGHGGTVSSSSTDSNSIQSYRYDVFISFRGPDVRNTFVDHLYTHLIRKGIFVFKDDKQLQKGKSISPQLLQAIKHSRVSIIVFSKDYATSTWCLDEMATIAECHRELKQTAFPVFYDVDPSHVRKQNGVYEDAFILQTKKFKHDPGKVDRWKRDMTCLAESVGWDVRNKSEFEEIEKIVQAVIKILDHKFSGFADDLIGIQPHVEALESLLKLSSEDDGFRVLGMWGMGGIGKTTLATVLYDRISYQFGACCFIENVSKIYRDGGAIAVQKQILRRTIEEKNLEAYNPSEISGIVVNRLHNIKLLVVLDNVDQYEQLEELHIKPKLLHAGSRIIITTRDEHLLEEYGADKVYEAKLMNDNDACKLLCRKAFKDDYSSSTFAEMILEVLKYVQNLPLAIRVMGSLLCTRNAIQWRATLDGLRNNSPDKRIIKVLQISFEGLEQREREILLHVACFFNGEREDYVRRILKACGLQPEIGIQLIIEKSLITIRNQEIHMHEMLQEMGKQIVREQHLNKPEFWSRLWHYEDFHHVMMTDVKSIEVEAIVLNQKEDNFKFIKWRAEYLSKMRHLKLLILNHNIFFGRPDYLSNSLCYLSWNGYPFTYLPSNFQPYYLVELNMPESSIEQLWEDMQDLPYLKRMDLSNSTNLKRILGFEGIKNLERLDLTGCINLSEVDPSIGCLKELVFLSLQNCSSLVNLDFGCISRLRALRRLLFGTKFEYAPDFRRTLHHVSKLTSLRVLRLCGCTKLEDTPDFTAISNLEYLDMDQCTSLSAIDQSLEALTKLRFLSLRDCINLVRLPNCFHSMTSLVTLDLRGCLKLWYFPLPSISIYSSHLKSLIFLDISFCKISEVPDAIGELKCLERLNLQGNNFIEIPYTIDRLSRLAYLNLSHCQSLEQLPKLPTESAASVGIYFKTTSESRDHRSGLYIFDCPTMAGSLFKYANSDEKDAMFQYFQFKWLLRLVKEPRHFRCGFDIVLPWHWKNMDFQGNHAIPQWFDHRFNGGSKIRIAPSNMHVDQVGFVFCVTFEVKNHPTIFGAPYHLHSSPLPHPFYLSFESEHAEVRFDMPLSLEQNELDGSKYLWIIYISREHCHFVETGAQITFKARHGLIMKEWGLRVLAKEDIEGSKRAQRTPLPSFIIDNVEGSSSNFVPEIQLPYNWSVSNEDVVENDEVKGKEINLFKLGLWTD